MLAGSRAIVAALVAAGLMADGPACAQTYPSRALKFIVPYPAGGTGDMVARIVGERLSAVLGQAVVVENRPGAAGAIGTKAVTAAAADGHTLLIGHTGEIAINPYWVKDSGYDPETDLSPVALAAVVPLGLVVPARAPYATVAEMLRLSNERGLSFASAGIGTPGHFAAEVLKIRTKSNLVHVPYKGAPPALNDLVGGHVDLFFSGLPAALPHVKGGALKLLAVSSGQRSGIVPDVPTVAEAAGIAGFDITLWMGFFVPRGTPKDVVARLNADINRILAKREVKQKLLEQGADVSPISVDQFAAFVQAEREKFQAIIKDADLTRQ